MEKAPNKGKQATKGQKQIEAENKETLKFYRNFVLVPLLLYVLVVFVYQRHYDDAATVIPFLFCQLMQWLSLYCLRYMARTTDLNMAGGVAEHVKDVLMVTAAVQTLSLLHLYLYLLWAVVPGRALHLLWANILAPYIFQEPPPEDEKKDKKRERKMKRQFVQ